MYKLVHQLPSTGPPKLCTLDARHARHTEKHFFTASLGRKNTKISGRSPPKAPVSGKDPPADFPAPGVARCRADSPPTGGRPTSVAGFLLHRSLV